MPMPQPLTVAALLLAAALGGCATGGPAEVAEPAAALLAPPPPRVVRPADIVLPKGYRIEAVATGLDFPTGVAFDGAGIAHVTEAGYAYGKTWRPPRLVRIGADGRHAVVAEGDDDGPWSGVAWHAGAFYVAAGGELRGGAILRISPDGATTPLVAGLPSLGDHHTTGPVVGPDGYIYFGQGTATNAGVVGEDNAAKGWLKRNPGIHDVPCRDLTLTGNNFTTASPNNPAEAITTGAFSPFGVSTRRGQVIRGQVPCNGAIMRIHPGGGKVDLVAWGLRNPFGLAFSPGGRLYATDRTYDQRGSRHVYGAGDLVWAIVPGTWYGWPDFHGDRPLLEIGHRLERSAARFEPLLAGKDQGAPPKPAAVLGLRGSGDGLDFSTNRAFGHVGAAFIAAFGDVGNAATLLGTPARGAKVLAVDVRDGLARTFAANKGDGGPASRQGNGGLERPIAARFDPAASALFVVDYGIVDINGGRPTPRPGTGVLWRITATPGDLEEAKSPPAP